MKLRAHELTDGHKTAIENWMQEVSPMVLPADWGTVEEYVNCRMYHGKGMKVFAEVEIQREHGSVVEQYSVDTVWLHVSVSRKSQVPSYADLEEVKRIFVGLDRKAIMVMPAASEHYNHHPYCLHLFAPLERDPLPDFRDKEGKL